MPGTHALLSPSAAHRWLNCTAAPRLEENIPDRGSVYAEEGTLAHAICAYKLKSLLGMPARDEEAEIDLLREKYWTEEMEEYTDAYVTIVREKLAAARKSARDAILLVEVRLDFSDYVPEAFGTADAVIVTDGCMEIIDFKYGKGVRVSAEDNPQMKIYALGAVARYGFDYYTERVRMTIVQPRLDNLSEWEITAADLQKWASQELRPRALEAYRGGAAPHPGAWCQFCKAAPQCRALANKALATQKKFPDPALLTPTEISRVLPVLSKVKEWAAAVEEYALRQALNGTHYPGYKVVEGRSLRRISDPEAVGALLASLGYHEEEYIRRSLVGIGGLEKLMGKKHFAETCRDYIVKPKGKPTLVPESDKRPAITAADDFAGIEQ